MTDTTSVIDATIVSEVNEFASSICAGICEDHGCRHLHILMNDEDGKPYAEAILPLEYVEDFITHLRGLVSAKSQ